MNFMIKNGQTTKSFFEGTFLGEDINYCNEIRAAILSNKNNLKKIINIIHKEIRKKMNLFLKKKQT